MILFSDDDRDGYYYGIDLLIDADTIYSEADVYAVVYLSLDGGPWNEYAATEDFTLFGASGDDAYVLVTELMSGYPRGSYDLLIELFDAWDGSFLASLGPEESSELCVPAARRLRPRHPAGHHQSRPRRWRCCRVLVTAAAARICTSLAQGCIGGCFARKGDCRYDPPNSGGSFFMTIGKREFLKLSGATAAAGVLLSACNDKATGKAPMSLSASRMMCSRLPSRNGSAASQRPNP